MNRKKSLPAFNEVPEFTWGMKTSEYLALLDASNRKKYEPSTEKIFLVMKKYPKLSEQDAIIALKLLNSPARGTFTSYDVHTHLNSL